LKKKEELRIKEEKRKEAERQAMMLNNKKDNEAYEARFLAKREDFLKDFDKTKTVGFTGKVKKVMSLERFACFETRYPFFALDTSGFRSQLF